MKKKTELKCAECGEKVEKCSKCGENFEPELEIVCAWGGDHYCDVDEFMDGFDAVFSTVEKEVDEDG